VKVVVTGGTGFLGGALVEALRSGHVDIAWNTPLAHVRVKQRTSGRSLSLGMRDSDRDFHAKIVVRRAPEASRLVFRSR